MDRKSLFNLPRELLIEIILNVKKQNEKQNEKEKEELMKKCVQTHMIKCYYKNCECFKVKNYYGEMIYSNTEHDIWKCETCSIQLCQKHSKIFYFICCDTFQCKSHHKCPTCDNPLCLLCEKSKLQCDECKYN